MHSRVEMLAITACCIISTHSFVPVSNTFRTRGSLLSVQARTSNVDVEDGSIRNAGFSGSGIDRRSSIQAASALLHAALFGALSSGQSAPASALGMLPETAAQSRAIAQAVVRIPAGMTPTAVSFFTNALFAKVLQGPMLRDDGSVVTTIGFGPQEYAVPADFVPGISGFSEYGSHFSLQLIAPPLAAADGSDQGSAASPTRGDGLAYVAMGVPQYRVSKLIEYGGEIKSSYGFTVVDAPGGLPLQVVLGDQVRDPFMFAAVYVTDMKASERYYTQELGMSRMPYPKARPALVSNFEPEQPPRSVYLGYSPDTFGLLLLLRPRKRGQSKKIDVGTVWGGLRIVNDDSSAASTATPGKPEPDSYPVSFVDLRTFNLEIAPPAMST